MGKSTWTTRQDNMILSGMPLDEIADATGRTFSAVETRRSVLRKAAKPALVEGVRELWGTDRPDAIGKRLGVDANVVWCIAKKHGLGPSGFPRGGLPGARVEQEAAKIPPDKPKGFSEEQLAFGLAAKHRGKMGLNDEGYMIAAMAGMLG